MTSDTHFNHGKLLHNSPVEEGYDRRCDRPFDSVEEMNETLIANWNSVVGSGDRVLHLGDFAMGNRKLIPGILERLKGNIVLIPGNHDYKRDDEYFRQAGHSVIGRKDAFVTIHKRGELAVKIELTHRPTDLKVEGVDVAFCGHVHELWSVQHKGWVVPDYVRRHNIEKGFKTACDIYNVGVDKRGFTPRLIEEILDESPPA